MLLRVVVTYDDRTGSGRTAISDATERVDQEGTLTLRPSLPVAGVAVTATLADPDGMLANHVWKWERSPRAGTPDWEVIIGATASTYTPTAEDDDGKLLRVIVAYDDALGGGRGRDQPIHSAGGQTGGGEPVHRNSGSRRVCDRDAHG